MNTNGYINFYRSIFFNPLFQNADGSYRSDYGFAWAWMISKAQFKTNGIGRGQLRCSESLLAKLFFCSKRRKARTFRAICEANNMIIWDPQNGQQMAIVTICNYEKYQGSELGSDQQSDQQPSEKRPTKRPLLEKGKKDNKNISSNEDTQNDTVLAFEVFIKFADHTGLPRPAKLTAKRKQKIKARLSEHGLENWTEALRRASMSEFIRSARWFTIDWLAANETNITKVLEGNYDNGRMAPVKSRDEQADERFEDEMRRKYLQNGVGAYAVHGH